MGTFYEQEELRDLVKAFIINHREDVVGKHTTSPHLYYHQERRTPDGGFRVHFYSKQGLIHNCWIAFTISDPGIIRGDHCGCPGMEQLEKVITEDLMKHFRAQGVKASLGFEDTTVKGRVQTKRILTLSDEILEEVPPMETAGDAVPIPQINHDVFISYSSKDKAVADAVCARLEGQGIRCWIAPRDVMPGINYQAGIVAAIRTSRIMVLVFSSSSNRSGHVLREVNLAVNKGVIILPFRIEDVPLTREMQYLIASQHWLDALTPPLEQHIQKLSENVKALLRPGPSPPAGQGTENREAG